jgi:hypothetical protein
VVEINKLGFGIAQIKPGNFAEVIGQLKNVIGVAAVCATGPFAYDGLGFSGSSNVGADWDAIAVIESLRNLKIAAHQ